MLYNAMLLAHFRYLVGHESEKNNSSPTVTAPLLGGCLFACLQQLAIDAKVQDRALAEF